MRIVWHPEPNTVAVVMSVNNVPVRLTEERWLHIIEFHRELEKFQKEVLLTVADPDGLYCSPKDVRPNFAAIKSFDKLAEIGLAQNIVVHYREVSPSNGFILTAFVISNDRLRRRFRSWQKLK